MARNHHLEGYYEKRVAHLYHKSKRYKHSEDYYEKRYAHLRRRRHHKKRRHKRRYRKYHKRFNLKRLFISKKGKRMLRRLRHARFGMKHLRHGRVRFYVSLNKKVLGAQNTVPAPKKTALPKADLSGIKTAQAQDENQLQ